MIDIYIGQVRELRERALVREESVATEKMFNGRTVKILLGATLLAFVALSLLELYRRDS